MAVQLPLAPLLYFKAESTNIGDLNSRKLKLGAIILLATVPACGPADEVMDPGEVLLQSQTACYDQCIADYINCGYGIACKEERALCLEACTPPPTDSSPHLFYAVGTGMGDGSSDVYQFKFSGGAITNFVKLGESGRILFDIALNPYSRVLYAIDSAGRLCTVSATNGSVTSVGSIGYFTPNALDFCPGVDDGGLFAWSSNGQLIRINMTTGAPTLIGSSGFSSSGDLACSLNGVLYGTALSGGADRLVRLDRSNGAATLIGSMGNAGMYGLETDQNNVLFAARGTSSQIQLFETHKYTGVSTMVATYATTAGLNGITTYSLPY